MTSLVIQTGRPNRKTLFNPFFMQLCETQSMGRRDADNYRGKINMANKKSIESTAPTAAASVATKDIFTSAVVIAAIIIFVGNGSTMMQSIIDMIYGNRNEGNSALQATLLLNIALILFGWRRYRDLTHEVRERADAEQRAQTLALRDPLTGFHNRRSIGENGTEMLAKALKRDKVLAIVMFDLDHFKTVNDLHGHAVGDALLRSVAAEMNRHAPENALLARLGGDEFACAMTYDVDQPQPVNDVVEAIVKRLSEPFDVSGIHAHISVSAGIARSSADCNSIDSLMRHADIAMYVAKREGRNRYSWFDASMEEELQQRSELETSMRSGIAAGQFEPYFEKQIDLASGKLAGFEVLARWHNPLRGLIMPDIFIPIAEETGMIGELSFSIIRKALTEARDWDQSLVISVNISPGQLRDPWLAQKIVKILTETGFPPQRLEIEITETALFENLEVAQSIIGSLKNQGIRLALDDFGTGYSSLAHLRALPFDRIKIDKSFVLSLEENLESAAIVNAIAQLGKSLSMAVTAEGIEVQRVHELLKEMGCAKGQGWLYGKPTSIKTTRAMLAENDLVALGAVRTDVQPLDLEGFEEAAEQKARKVA
jgi:diguanylate cyclase (GGDEF)-like protein